MFPTLAGSQTSPAGAQTVAPRGGEAHEAQYTRFPFLLRPPYVVPVFTGGTVTTEGVREFPGTVLGFLITRSVPDLRVLQRELYAVRARFPFAPIMLLLRLPMEETLYVGSRASMLGVRASVGEGQPIHAVVRRSLSDSTALAQQVVEWLDLRGVRLSPAVRQLLQNIFLGAAEHREIGAVLREVGTPESTARFQLHKRRLPAPGRWHQAARALLATLRMQAEPDRPLLSLAYELGYADHSALSQLVNRTFGLRPGRARTILGWEWLMDRWLQRTGTETRDAFVTGAAARAGSTHRLPTPMRVS
ncbi:MAG TPA: helix-turn-helix domain-containing protein [Longimicrobiaceae bacterium]|nr:helix-turn-helix domain-containing protein [Longimicrobiaceae bacterium]